MKMTLIQGNCLKILPTLPSESIDLIITSPPYWGLRDYGIDGQLGNEPTMEAYLNNLLKWVRECYRILKPSGSFVLNIGDCFFTKRSLAQTEQVANSIGYVQKRQGFPEEYGIYKTKQLLSISSFAYCRIVSETDFVCRGEHIWCKPNVPTPIRSRLKSSHEKLFWFVKDAESYYFDNEPWMKKITESSNKRYENATSDSPHCDNIGLSQTSCFRAGEGHEYLKNKDTIEHSWRIVPESRSNDEMLRYMREKAKGQANIESSEEFRKKHEDTAFPIGSFHKYQDEVIEHSWRVVSVGEKQNGFELSDKPISEHIAPFPSKLIKPYVTSLCPQEGTILDPFLGSGTVMRLAMENNRSCIGIELNPSYCAYAKKRVNWGNSIGHIEFDEVKEVSP